MSGMSRCLAYAPSGDSPSMSPSNNPSVKPTDATKPTEEQRAVQEKLDNSNDDPEAPGGHQDRNDIPDENGR